MPNTHSTGRCSSRRRPTALIAAITFSLASSACPFAWAEVLPETKPVQAAQPSQIKAQQKLLIAGIQVVGNNSISSETILGATSIKPGTEVPVTTLESVVKADMNAIVALGTIADVHANLEQYKNGALLVYTVQENPVLGSVEIVGNDFISDAELTAVLTSKVGQVIDRSTIQKDLEAINARYVKDGLSLTDCKVDLIEGSKLVFEVLETRIEKIEIKGNQKTKEYVISRQLISKAGKALDEDDIRVELRRIYNLGFFDEVVPVFIPGEKAGQLTYCIQVKERKAGNYGGALTYSPSDGIMGQLYVTDNNLLGRGQSLSLNAEIGIKKSRSFEVSFMEPWLLEGKTSLEVHVFDKDTRQLDNFDEIAGDFYMEHRVGGDVTAGYKLNEDDRVSVGIGTEYTTNRDADDAPITMDGDGSTNFVNLTFTRDKRDNVIFPQDGYKFSGSARMAGGILGGDNEFVKLQASYSTYKKMGKDDVIAVRVAGGKTINDGDLAAQERFRVGGSETVRGYDFGEFQGDSMVYTNLEYRKPVEKVGSLVLFLDAGNAWSSADGESFGALHVSTGIGARVNTPIGELRLDWGITKKDDGSLGGKLHFSVGQTF